MTARNDILCPSNGKQLSSIHSVGVAFCKIVGRLGMSRKRAGTQGLLLPFIENVCCKQARVSKRT